MNFGMKAAPKAKTDAIPTITEQNFEQEVLRPELPGSALKVGLAPEKEKEKSFVTTPVKSRKSDV